MLLLFLVFEFGSSILYSQVKEQNQSNAEKFSSKSGVLIKKEFLVIGTFKGVKIEVVYYTDLMNNIKQSAARLEYEVNVKYGDDTKITTLDTDEIDALIKAIKIIQECVLTTKAANYSEVSFTSRGGFEAGCYWYNNDWSIYLKLKEFDSDSYVLLKREDFSQLLIKLEEVKSKL